MKYLFALFLFMQSFLTADIIDDYMKHKIILCTGPALHRYEMLEKTIKHDLKFIKYKKIFITTNDKENYGIKFKKFIPNSFYLISEKGKQIDCINCIISTLRNCVNDRDIKDDDIILFKHESVYVNDMNLIRQSVGKIIIDGYDMVIRFPDPDHYKIEVTATDAFFIKVGALRDFVKDFYDISDLPSNEGFCELYIQEKITKFIPRVFKVKYVHNNGGNTELGFYHYINPQNEYAIWDKKNYNDIFKE